MRRREWFLHIAGVLLFLFFTLGIMLLRNQELVGRLFGGEQEADAVTGASLAIPDEPSGEYYILINRDMHRDTLEAWKAFFRDEDFAVIFEDVRCIVAAGDENARQLADRYMAQLPENQMTVRAENPVLLASKCEAGRIDIAIFSKEAADRLGVSSDRLKKVELLLIGGAREE